MPCMAPCGIPIIPLACCWATWAAIRCRSICCCCAIAIGFCCCTTKQPVSMFRRCATKPPLAFPILCASAKLLPRSPSPIRQTLFPRACVFEFCYVAFPYRSRNASLHNSRAHCAQRDCPRTVLTIYVVKRHLKSSLAVSSPLTLNVAGGRRCSQNLRMRRVDSSKDYTACKHFQCETYSSHKSTPSEHTGKDLLCCS